MLLETKHGSFYLYIPKYQHRDAEDVFLNDLNKL